MKRYLLFIIVLHSACQASYEKKAAETDCNKFKKGRFFHQSQGDPTIYKIERTDSIQTEIIGKTGDFVKLKIRWTGPCTYELTFLNQHMYSMDSISESLQKSLKVKVEITNVRNDTCFVITDNGSQQLPGIVYIDKK
ncbi:MAG: hypothetical protein ABIR78_12080 [Ferruginibacter sp.]